MNTENILKMARTQIPDLNSVGKDIYKGTLSIEDKIAGVYYFDLSNDIPDDFENYQEQLLSDEFYDHPGSRQWNYYLFLLNDRLDPEQKKKIERNDRYARKFVFDEAEFKDFFHFEKGGDEIQTSIVAQWKAALDAADLQEVYGEGTYVDIFERFSGNNTKKQKIPLGKGNIVVADHIDFINRVLLKASYRKYPLDIKEFHFGKVNLVQGINGVGKTSLFEAIELMLCGGTLRNKQQLNENGCLEAEYNASGTLVRYQAKNTALYQSRDLSWYSTTNLRGNTLYNSFNRFNYFNADAAQQFSVGGSQEEISSALFNIVLGPEYSYIQERSSKMLSRVSPAYKKLETELEYMNRQLLAAEKVISKYRQPENMQTMLNKISESTSQLDFINGSFDYRTQSALIEQENNRLQVLLSYFAEDNFSFDTLGHHQRLLLDFKMKKEAFTILIEKMRGFNHELTEQQKKTKKLENHLDIVFRARGYLQDSRFIELRGLDEKTRRASFQRQRKQFVKDSIEGVSLIPVHSGLSLHAYLEVMRTQLEVEERESKELNQQITDEIAKLGRISGLLKEIKLSGISYLELDISAIDCPMCHSSYERSELEARIRNLDEIEIGENKAMDINSRRKAMDLLNEKINRTKTHIQGVEKIRSAYLAYFEKGDTISLEESMELLGKVAASIPETDAEIWRLREIADFSRLSGKSEQDLKSLDSSMEAVLGSPVQLSLADLEWLDNFKNSIEKQLSEQEVLRSVIMEKRYGVGLDIKKLVVIPAEEQVELKVVEDRLNHEGDKLEVFKRHFDGISSSIALKDDASLTELKAASDLLSANIASYRETTRGEIEVNAAKQTKKETEKFEQENRVRYQRMKKAFDTLKSLSENEESEKELQVFFKQNFAEIADIFRSIHMPREFTDLRFDGKTVTLRDELGKLRGVTEISTGQRSALALSIFLSLNRKLTDGPNLIMFDDPVAFIDDFNALSFLDYLRNYVLTSGRQIFFATANARLANLFEKKFNFLGEEFVRYDLTR